MIEGNCVSFTVTVNEQLAGLPLASLTEQFTVVVPSRKLSLKAERRSAIQRPDSYRLPLEPDRKPLPYIDSDQSIE